MTGIIILHYNRVELTAACVHSLLQSTCSPARILVVDNASESHTEADLRAALPHPIEVLRLPQALGFAGGMNAGIRHLLSDPSLDSILLLNNDTRAPAQLIECLRKELEADPEVGVVGCELEGAEGGGSQAARFRLTGFFALPKPVPENEPYDYLLGSCLLIRRTVLESVGLLDESFFFFGEDADFSLRVQHAGWKLAVARGIKLFLVGSATIGTDSEKQAAWYRASTRQYLSKWRSFPLLRSLPPFFLRVCVDIAKGRWGAVRGAVHGFFHRNLAAEIRFKTRPASGCTIAVNTLFLLPGQVGGSETALRCTLRELALAAPEHRFLLFTNRENHDALLADLSRFPNVALLPTGISSTSRLARLWGEWCTIPRLCQQFKPNVLWCPGNFAPPWSPCRVVTTIYDMQYRSFPQDYSPLELLYMRFFTAISIRFSQTILTISDFSRDEIVRAFPTAQNRVEVALLGVGETFSQHPTTPSPANRLLCIANTYPHKHVEDAVRIFALLADEFPSLSLDLVGQPRRGEPLLQQEIDHLPAPIRSRIRRIHRLSQTDLTSSLQSASVFLFPSRYEGFGLPILEALKAEVPVVAMRAASIPEVGGAFVHLVEPGDIQAAAQATRTLLHHPPSRDQRIAGHHWANQFTWQATASKTLRTLLAQA